MVVLIDTNVLIDYLAMRPGFKSADYIVTSNTADFANGNVPAIAPDDFLKLI